MSRAMMVVIFHVCPGHQSTHNGVYHDVYDHVHLYVHFWLIFTMHRCVKLNRDPYMLYIYTVHIYIHTF